MAVDLKLNADNDLVILNGDLQLVTEDEEIAQHIKTRLMTWQGEWILDFGMGLDWLDKIFTIHTSQEKRDAAIKKVITDTPGVKEITNYVFDVDIRAHSAVINFSVTTIYGSIVQEIRT